MIYAEITYIGKNKDGKDKLDFQLYGATTEMIGDYLASREEWRKSALHEHHFDGERSYLLISREFPLHFLAEHEFVPITKDFFFLKD
jgi:hypothetical protein